MVWPLNPVELISQLYAVMFHKTPKNSIKKESDFFSYFLKIKSKIDRELEREKEEDSNWELER